MKKLSKKQELLDKMYPGDEEYAKAVLKEMKNLTAAFDSFSAVVGQGLPREEGAKYVRIIAESCGSIAASIILPLHSKFPHLDPLPSREKTK